MGADTDSFLTIPVQINNHVDHILKISYTKHNNDLLALKAMNREISKMLKIQNRDDDELNKLYQASEEIIKKIFKQK